MKIATLLAGVAAVALTASAASADTINRGQFGGNGPLAVNVQGGTFLGDIAAGLNRINAQSAGSPISAWHAFGGSQGDNGTAANNDGATFTLKGVVSTDCAYYSGSSNSQTIDFGTIGIFASDNTGPAAAFDMTAPANVTIDSNLAGCNTSNTVTLSKSDIRGLVNNSSAGYDTNVFQANLPFSVTANYTAGAVGVAGAASPTSLVLTAASNSVSAQHGAWKSAMALNVNIPVPSKSLLAGSYQGDLTVNIAAF
ncbi:hypothetical protein [Brevundimonas pondensis]|uniref:Uncharacterized protein n=1 Tax=Brevundimonas pondensis TaxID=2774189 RepID=A0ABX7SIT1_9CAUL|nr:hypothetical protein [Brevundimonas pondensis]QTC86732.1 hypothetical protein IFE19_11335 [Brevundimonas pondensis]